ncbi:GNAT family N-acetyltransferase [Spirillospora sp. CA-294931]|uniref:GNAT family N-acetyltransferase n=1 Tax=Spirillospora sp. CA-294931 TaxID=3240042 RepID=UPI003D8A39C3
MKEIVTYVEMTSPEELNPAAPVPDLLLEPLERNVPVIHDLVRRIGSPYRWESAERTEEGWDAWFAASPDRAFWMLSFKGEPAGMVGYDVHQDGDVEIETFGLLPEFVGKGLGGFALTMAIQRAWQLTPAATRVWLHTSTLDHPNALPNYHRRGFRTFKTEEGTQA